MFKWLPVSKIIMEEISNTLGVGAVAAGMAAGMATGVATSYFKKDIKKESSTGNVKN